MVTGKQQVTNSVTLIGNLGLQAELYRADGKVPFGKARIAVWQGKDKPACWLTIAAFGDLADRLAEMPRGARIRVQGRLRASTYVGQDGSKRQSVEIVADSIRPVSRPEQQQSEAAAA